MKRISHPDFFSIDLPRLEEQLGDEARFTECIRCLDQALLELSRDPLHEGVALALPPLTEYRKKKFHSVLRPASGSRADMRLIYRYDSKLDTLYVLGVGKRTPREADDVHHLLNTRESSDA